MLFVCYCYRVRRGDLCETHFKIISGGYRDKSCLKDFGNGIWAGTVTGDPTGAFIGAIARGFACLGG